LGNLEKRHGICIVNIIINFIAARLFEGTENIVFIIRLFIRCHVFVINVLVQHDDTDNKDNKDNKGLGYFNSRHL
jgi:hypothetical protein